MAAALVALPILAPVLTVVETVQNRQDVLSDLKKFCHVILGLVAGDTKLHKLPHSKPIAPASQTADSPLTGLDRLPPEIRLRIYHYAFPGHRVVQPEPKNGKMRIRFGLLPASSLDVPSYIRGDADPPSTVLRMILEDGGSPWKQSSPRMPSTKLGPGRLICGDSEAWSSSHVPGFFGAGNYSGLLQASRTVYREVLYELYGRHTFSFFGPEMLQFFLDNASPEGRQYIRYVHLALPFPREDSELSAAMDGVACAIRRLRLEFPSLTHLDVEFVFPGGQPSDPAAVVQWIRHQAFDELRCGGLEQFVLKVSVLHAIKADKFSNSKAGVQPLEMWDRQAYLDLKGEITGC